MAIQLPKKIIDAIKEAPKGVVPNGIRALGKKYSNQPDVLSEDSNTLGNTYRQVGPLHILKKGSTADSRKKALASRRAKEIKAGKRKK